MSEEIYKAARLQRLAAKTLPKKVTNKGARTDAIRRRMRLEDQAANSTDFRRLNRPGAGPSGVSPRDISPFGKAEDVEVEKFGALVRLGTSGLLKTKGGQKAMSAGRKAKKTWSGMSTGAKMGTVAGTSAGAAGLGGGYIGSKLGD